MASLDVEGIEKANQTSELYLTTGSTLGESGSKIEILTDYFVDASPSRPKTVDRSLTIDDSVSPRRKQILDEIFQLTDALSKYKALCLNTKIKNQEQTKLHISKLENYASSIKRCVDDTINTLKQQVYIIDITCLHVTGVL